MYLSRIELREDAARNPEFWSGLSSVRDAHRMVWNWFTDREDRERDFLFRIEGDGASTRVYTLSERVPVDPRGLWSIESKAFAPNLRMGTRLAFALRVNPTLRKSNGVGKGKRHDVVMDARFQARTRGQSLTREELVQESCVAWMATRAERLGFEIDSEHVRAEGYRPVRLPRGSGRDDATITIVDLKGVLTVTDPDRFVAGVCQGIGPAKAFGCGLILIRRI